MISSSAPWSGFKLLQSSLVVLIILYLGRGLFVPLSFALLISFILYPICRWLEGKKFKRTTAIIISLSGLFVLTSALLYGVILQLISFTKEWPRLQTKLGGTLRSLSDFVTQSFGISQEEQMSLFSDFLHNSSSDALQLLKQTISASAVSLVLAILIPIYAYLILYYRHRLVNALFYVFPEEGRANIRDTLYQSIQSYYDFIKGMAVVYLIVGTLNSIGLLALGIPHAILFGFAASVFTIIPYVGIIAASLLPISLAWVTYQSPLYPLGVVVLFAVVQYLEANVIFPWAVSDRLKINTLVTIVVIIAGGIIWGAAGMILFIPFLGILKLIADRHPKMKFLSVLLGAD